MVAQEGNLNGVNTRTKQLKRQYKRESNDNYDYGDEEEKSAQGGSGSKPGAKGRLTFNEIDLECFDV